MTTNQKEKVGVPTRHLYRSKLSPSKAILYLE